MIALLSLRWIEALGATPVVVDGVMFVSSGLGNVFAIDARRGSLKWKYRSDATTGTTTHRGVVVAEGKVFAGQRDNTLIALDQEHGTLIWKTRLAEAGRGFTSAPTVYFDGLVYIGVAGGEGVHDVTAPVSGRCPVRPCGWHCAPAASTGYLIPRAPAAS